MTAPDSTSATLISARHLTLGYGNRIVFRDLSFSIQRGDLLGLVGPNGGGKTTLLRAVLGSLKPRAGEITWHSDEIDFGYVPQRQHLDPVWPLRTLDVVVMGTYGQAARLRRLAAQHTEAALEALGQVGIRQLAERRYSELSGGQKQRVLVARALAANPSLMVLDEPTQGMDLSSSTGILRLVERLHGEGITVLLASHRLNTVANYVRRVALVQDGAFQIGSREEVLTGENLSALYGMKVDVSRDDENCLLIMTE